MSAKEPRPVASEPGLSKQRLVDEAVRLADRDGVDGLSMRRLAGTLGAGAMSLYHYVASKDELLDAMIDTVFAEIELPPLEADWQTAMRRQAVSARQVLARHPWAIGLMESRTTPGPANLRHREAVTASRTWSQRSRRKRTGRTGPATRPTPHRTRALRPEHPNRSANAPPAPTPRAVADVAGNDTLIWPHRDGLFWPRSRHSGAVVTV